MENSGFGFTNIRRASFARGICELHLVILENLRDRENPNFKGSTILLTHVPMYKKAGLCRDGPEHKYYINNEKEPTKW